jgi:hypothetical protein
MLDGPHPEAVSFGEVVVHRHQVSALVAQCVQVQREGSDQSLAFTGLHLRDAALMKDYPAEKLHIEMTQTDGTSRRFTNCGKCRRQYVFESRPAREAAAQFETDCGEVVVAPLRKLRFEVASATHQRVQLLQLFLIGIEESAESFADERTDMCHGEPVYLDMGPLLKHSADGEARVDTVNSLAKER